MDYEELGYHDLEQLRKNLKKTYKSAKKHVTKTGDYIDLESMKCRIEEVTAQMKKRLGNDTETTKQYIKTVPEFGILAHFNKHTKKPKVGYKTLDIAVEKSGELSKKYDKKYIPYFCSFCSKYHLTTKKIFDK